MLDEFMQARAEEAGLAASLAAGRCGDPFSVLGMHRNGDGWVLRAFLPGAERVEVRGRRTGSSLGYLQPQGDGLFTGRFDQSDSYLFSIAWGSVIQETEDPYAFGALLSSEDLAFAAAGQHWRMRQPLGAFPITHEGVPGIRFAVWAPNAHRVSVVGNFNTWDGRRHPMRLRHEAGIWEIFIPRLQAGECYKYEILGVDGLCLPLKADPFARRTEAPPATASVVAEPSPHPWTDQAWMAERDRGSAARRPISVYEVHPGSWLRPEGRAQDFPDWDLLGDRLVPYVASLGFTHIELLPIMEHPFGGSWGYQPLALFAPTARYGSPQQFAAFVDRCHRENIGVILDWVPGHFPTDAHGMALFDGTHLYEHADPREGFHQDWNTLIFNLGRREVRGYLIASALYWLEHFHIDGLRVDAVASLLYRDYSRQAGEWVPNIHGGRENLESISFLRELNEVVHRHFPAVAMIAEESTAWPGVTAPVETGGLGFDFKWNMGWMHDTLSYIQRQPVHRNWHHSDMTFGLAYAFSEKFVLPLSHDEVVHGKGSLWGRIPGEGAAKAATLRAYYAFMWTHPGKKLLFMGGELGQTREWNHDGEIDWNLLESPDHAGLQRLVGDLNRLYRARAAFHASDAEPTGFSWIVGDDEANSVFAYMRLQAGEAPILCLLNMTPIARENYQLGVPRAGLWHELLNTDAGIYGGCDRGNQGMSKTRPVPLHGHPHSLDLYLPPLSMLIFSPEA